MIVTSNSIKMITYTTTQPIAACRIAITGVLHMAEAMASTTHKISSIGPMLREGDVNIERPPNCLQKTIMRTIDCLQAGSTMAGTIPMVASVPTCIIRLQRTTSGDLILEEGVVEI